MVITNKRPRLLTLICLKGFIWSFINLIYVFSPVLKHQSIWLPALYGLTIALRFISYVGVWHMKKWGVHLFILDFSAGLAILSLYGIEINSSSLVLGIISVITFPPYYQRMDEN